MREEEVRTTVKQPLITTKKYYSYAISCSSVFCVLALWWVSSERAWVNPLFVPTPHTVWTAFYEIVNSGYKEVPLLIHIGSSMRRLFLALILACVTAVPLGILCGRLWWIRAIFDPFIEFYRPLPPLAYYSLLVLWFGITDLSKVILLLLGAFAPLFIASVYSIRRIPRDRINVGKSLGASGWRNYIYVIFPSCLPDVLTGLRTAVGVTFGTLVAAEMVAALSGVGWMVLDASKFLRSDIIYAAIIIMGLIAITIDGMLRWLIRRVSPWIKG